MAPSAGASIPLSCWRDASCSLSLVGIGSPSGIRDFSSASIFSTKPRAPASFSAAALASVSYARSAEISQRLEAGSGAGWAALIRQTLQLTASCHRSRLTNAIARRNSAFEFPGSISSTSVSRVAMVGRLQRLSVALLLCGKRGLLRRELLRLRRRHHRPAPQRSTRALASPAGATAPLSARPHRRPG